MTKPALSTRETIGARPDEVWAALTDWDNAPEWMPGIDSMTAEGDLARGTQITFRARGRDRRSTIAGVEPGRSLLLRSEQGGVTADYSYELNGTDDDRTEVSLVATCRTRGPIWSAAAPLLRIAMRRADRSQLVRLKALVETGRQ